ncbi:LSM domain-containing protein [Myriangium duriaei CBS 260.36]|uniref:Sm protein F n=1 Tax=Myriangium duriaei CBS 260.36 TaxID=1168546 RepID=A0A9P4J0Y6_9PEZI|nr:LSM domain-containing protein [Myriangium duriaei CBS 260.36]
MAAVVPKNPRPMLQELVNDQVIVRLKWGETEYHGKLVSVDSYMNIQLSEALEMVEGEEKGTLGNILIRCNNVLWISARNAAQNGDVKMES